MAALQTTTEVKTGGKPPSGLSEFWFYFSRNKGAVIGLAFFLVILFVAVFAPIVSPHSPSAQNRELLLLPPGLPARRHVGGTFSAPTPSAAISSRASSTVRVSRSSSASSS